jgi:hypothetical protein
MAYSIIQKTGEQNWINLCGQLTVQDFLQLQALGKESLERFGRFRVLVELEDFQGWSKEPGWEHTSFLMEEADQVSRIAFIGDEKWKDDIFLFTGKPLRATAMEFFPPERIAEAQAWLSE